MHLLTQAVLMPQYSIGFKLAFYYYKDCRAVMSELKEYRYGHIDMHKDVRQKSI